MRRMECFPSIKYNNIYYLKGMIGYDRLQKNVMISVLFVDDEPVQLEIGKQFLERTGNFSVDTLGSAREALASENLQHYDAIVSDYLMPGTDGIALLQEIRSAGNPVPFILFTGKGREETAILALNGGADFYVRKSVNADKQFAELGLRIQMAVQRQRDKLAIQAGEKALRHANEKLSLLASITRHDIRNQLLVLNSYLLLSQDSLDDAEKTAEYIRKEEGVAEIIEHLIAFTDEYETLGANIPVWQNVEQCIRYAVSELDLTGVGLNAGEMNMVEIFADSLLQKVFFNLVDNSLRHGGNTLMQINISCHETENGLVLRYQDDGSGIPPDQKELIFSRGYGKNTGFGLFFIRDILGITGITIRECGEPGKGARFEITVPKGEYQFVKEQR
jgi:signal transduction histidine kinase